MTYKAPTAQIDFILTHVVPFADLARTDRFAEATAETATAILSEAGKLAQNVLAPLNRGSDQTPARLENGVCCDPRPALPTGSGRLRRGAGSACRPIRNTAAWACRRP